MVMIYKISYILFLIYKIRYGSTYSEALVALPGFNLFDML